MTVGAVQCTMRFKEPTQGDDYGWSESHFHTKSDDLVTCLNDLRDLADLRKMLLGCGVVIEELFVSDVTIWRDAKADVGPIAPISPSGPLYNAQMVEPSNGGIALADAAPLSTLVRLDAAAITVAGAQVGPLYRRPHWISGVADFGQSIARRDPTFYGPFAAAWANYRDFLTADPPNDRWGFRVKSRDQSAVFEKAINRIDPVTGVLTVRQADPALAIGQIVQIRGVRGLEPRLAGTYQILNRVDAGPVASITLRNVGTAGGGVPFDGAYESHAWIRLLRMATVPYRKATIMRTVNRRRAGPLAPLKARRKARPRAVMG